MNSELPADDPVLRAVRQHLDLEASQVDASKLLRAVQSREGQAVHRRQRLKKWLATSAIGLTVAASLAIIMIFGGGPAPQLASASELLAEAQLQHAAPTDRCYSLVVEWEPNTLWQAPVGPLIRKSTIWTRGDQFRMESVNPQGEPFVWGQNQADQIWVALNRKRGLLYDQQELSEPFLRHIELVSLRMITLLGELLQDFELFRRDSGQPGEPIRIVAKLRPRHQLTMPRFGYVELELDPVNKTIRKAVLQRLSNGEIVNSMQFELIEVAELPVSSYELSEYLDPDGLQIDGKPMRDRLKGWPDPRERFRDEFLKRWQAKRK